MSVYKKLDTMLAKATETFCSILLVLIIAICFSNTVGRYLFSKPIVWAEEIVRYMSVWLATVGASLTARVDGHTTLDFVQETVKNRKVKVTLFLVTRILAILSMVVLFPAGLELVNKLGKATSPASGLPTWVLYASYPVGTACIILGYVRSIPIYAKKILEGE